MCIKIIFLNSPIIGNYLKLINLHFLSDLFYEAKIPGEWKYSQVFYVFCHPAEV